MGLLDMITGALGNNDSQGGMGGLLGSLLQGNGLQDIVGKLQQGGLGEQVGSWISTGQNLPVSADQLSQVLGNEQVQNIASKLGIDASAASGQLAQYLPQVIDALTPNGQLPEGGADAGGLMGMLGGLLGGK